MKIFWKIAIPAVVIVSILVVFGSQRSNPYAFLEDYPVLEAQEHESYRVLKLGASAAEVKAQATKQDLFVITDADPTTSSYSFIFDKNGNWIPNPNLLNIDGSGGVDAKGKPYCVVYYTRPKSKLKEIWESLKTRFTPRLGGR